MEKIKLSEIKAKSGIGFGSSGIRGLSSELTDEIVYAYTLSFLKYIDETKRVAIAGDLRESSDRIMRVVAKAIIDSRLKVVNCGKIPTPALAFYGVSKEIPSIMVTGSHIPADRNGIKFFKKDGEILKEDEAAISASEVEYERGNFETDLSEIDKEAENIYIERYQKMFENGSLEGLKIGLYGHSAVGREISEKILKNLGAEVSRLGFSETFIPVDTEVISEDTKKLGQEWNESGEFDALVATDGDGDRPLLGDEKGQWLRSDILGILTAKFLGAEVAVVPVSCNTALEKSAYVKEVSKTKIGSPYIVAEMMAQIRKGKKKVIGYEANGGFFTEELMTRDAILPLLCWLSRAKEEGKKISELFNELPKRYTESNSVKGFPTEKSFKIIEAKETLELVEKEFGKISEINRVDGLRIILDNGDIVHLRPSLNSPEFRDYVESDSPTKAKEISDKIHDMITEWNK